MRFLISLLFISSLCYPGSIDSLQNIISSSKGKPKYEKSIELAEILYVSNDSLALKYVDEAINFAQTENEPIILMKARSVKGDIFFHLGNFKLAGDEYKNSLILAEKHKNTEYLYENCKQLGAVFYSLADYKTSAIFYYKSLDLARLLEDDLKEAHILTDLGSVFDAVKDYGKAVEFSNQALEIYQKNSKMLEVAKVYNNLAITFNNQGEAEKALEIFEKALNIYVTNNDMNKQAIILNNMASILIDKKNYDEAIGHLNKSSMIFRQSSDNLGIALNDLNFGKAFFFKNNMSNAVSHFNNSLKFAEENGILTLIRDNYLYLSKVDSARSDFKSAFEYKNKYVEVSATIIEESKQREIYETMSKYELSQKEKQNFSLIRDNEIKKLEIAKQRQINNFFIIIFILLVAMAVFAYRSFNLKAKNEMLLKDYSGQIEELNKRLQEEIEKTKLELNESNEKLRKTEKEAARIDKLVSLGTMVAGITHEIKNPTQVIKLSMDSVRLSLNDLAVFIYELIKLNKKTNKKSSVEIKQLIEKHKITKVFNDIKNLIISNKKSVELIDQIVTSTTKISHFNRDTTDNLLNDIINDVLVIMKNSVKYSANIEVELDQNLPRYKCNYQEISQIVINLLTNARDAITDKELGTGEGLIKIRSGVENSNIFIEVSDNGTGISPDQKDKIFDAFYTTKTTGKGQGLGLSIVKSIVDIYGGFISIDSELGEGSSFKIYFPLNINSDAKVEDIAANQNKEVENA